MNSKYLIIIFLFFSISDVFGQQIPTLRWYCRGDCEGESILGVYRYKFEYEDTTYSEDLLVHRTYEVMKYWGGAEDSIWQTNIYASKNCYYTAYEHFSYSAYLRHGRTFNALSGFGFREPFLCNPSCDVQRGAFLRFFDLRAEASAKDSLEDNCWNGRFFLMEKIHYPEGSDNVLYKFEMAEKNREKPTSMFIRYSFLSFFELHYLHNIGFIYADIYNSSYTSRGKWVKITLTHIEGVPLEEYLRDCKGTLCPYFGN